MNKKQIIETIFAALLTAGLFTYRFGAELYDRITNTYYTVTAKNGAPLRSGPRYQMAIVGRFPGKARLKLIKKDETTYFLNGSTGRFIKVIHPETGQAGWVFSSNLK